MFPTQAVLIDLCKFCWQIESCKLTDGKTWMHLGGEIDKRTIYEANVIMIMNHQALKCDLLSITFLLIPLYIVSDICISQLDNRSAIFGYNISSLYGNC